MNIEELEQRLQEEYENIKAIRDGAIEWSSLIFPKLIEVHNSYNFIEERLEKLNKDLKYLGEIKKALLKTIVCLRGFDKDLFTKIQESESGDYKEYIVSFEDKTSDSHYSREKALEDILERLSKEQLKRFQEHYFPTKE